MSDAPLTLASSVFSSASPFRIYSLWLLNVDTERLDQSKNIIKICVLTAQIMKENITSTI